MQGTNKELISTTIEAQMKEKHPTTHDEYLREKNLGLQEAANQLRAIVKKSLPKAKEAINPWHVPIFELHGPICYYMAGKNHITLGFIRGTSLPDPEGLLEGTGKNLRHVKIKSVDDLNRKGLRELIKSAAALNAKEPQDGMRPYRK
jgi:hypothetical protein